MNSRAPAAAASPLPPRIVPNLLSLSPWRAHVFRPEGFHRIENNTCVPRRLRPVEYGPWRSARWWSGSTLYDVCGLEHDQVLRALARAGLR
jgi:hypothetical protein